MDHKNLQNTSAVIPADLHAGVNSAMLLNGHGVERDTLFS